MILCPSLGSPCLTLEPPPSGTPWALWNMLSCPQSHGSYGQPRGGGGLAKANHETRTVPTCRAQRGNWQWGSRARTRTEPGSSPNVQDAAPASAQLRAILSDSPTLSSRHLQPLTGAGPFGVGPLRLLPFHSRGHVCLLMRGWPATERGMPSSGSLRVCNAPSAALARTTEEGRRGG